MAKNLFQTLNSESLRPACEEGELPQTLKRIYACIPIKDPAVIEALCSASRDLPPKSGAHHLTLRFVYQIEREALSQWAAKIERICEHYEPFELALDSPGFFPEGVVWYSVKSPETPEGVSDYPRPLMALQAEIDQAALELGLQGADYAYNPHITLAKVRDEARAVEAPVRTWRAEDLEIRQIVPGAGNKLLRLFSLGSR